MADPNSLSKMLNKQLEDEGVDSSSNGAGSRAGEGEGKGYYDVVIPLTKRGGTRGGTRGGAGWEETPSEVSWGGMRVFKTRAGVRGGTRGGTQSEDGGWRARAHDARAGVWREGGGALRNRVARATAHIGSYTANAASMFQHHVRGVSDLSYAEHLAMTDSTSIPTSLLETSSGRDPIGRVMPVEDETGGMGSVEYVLGCARGGARGGDCQGGIDEFIQWWNVGK